MDKFRNQFLYEGQVVEVRAHKSNDEGRKTVTGAVYVKVGQQLGREGLTFFIPKEITAHKEMELPKESDFISITGQMTGRLSVKNFKDNQFAECLTNLEVLDFKISRPSVAKAA